MAYKMKGHSLPGPNQRKSPAKDTKYFGETTTVSESSAVTAHNKKHKDGSWDKDHKTKSPAKQGLLWDENSAAELAKAFPPKKRKKIGKIDGESQRKIKRKNKQATRIATRHSKAVEKGKDKRVARLEKKMERKGIETPKQNQARYTPNESYTGSKTAYSRRTPGDHGAYTIEPKKKK